MRKIVSFFMLILIITAGAAIGEESYMKAEKMATEIHNKVTTDVIYTDQEIKALYYQNIQIIQLLNDIKDLLRQNLIEKKEG